MSDEQRNPQVDGPVDGVVPSHPAVTLRRIQDIRDHVRDDPSVDTAERLLNLALVLLQYTACPHRECPLMLGDHAEPDGEGHEHPSPSSI